MCDFYSEIIRKDGTRFHRSHNSHSQMAVDAGWGENTPTTQVFWEFEWDPTEPLRGTGVRGDNPPERVLEAARKTVEELEAALRGKFALRWKGAHGADVRYHVAGNTNTPPKVLTALAEDSNADVRWSVAGNTNTPPKVLTALAEDSNADVRRSVAGNTNTPPKVLTALAEDSEVDVRWSVALNANTPPKALTALAEDSNTAVRWSVAGNTNTPPKTLTALAKDSNADVRRNAALNANFPG